MQRLREEAEQVRRTEELRRQLQEKNDHGKGQYRTPQAAESGSSQQNTSLPRQQNTRTPHKKNSRQAHRKNWGSGPRQETESTRTRQWTCRHGGWWPQVDGRHRCPRCQVVTALYALQCPTCSMIACASCRVPIQKGWKE